MQKQEARKSVARAIDPMKGDIGAKDTKSDNTNSQDPAASFNPFPIASPMHREFDEYRTWVISNKKLAAVGDSATPGYLLRLSGQLQAKGVPRLPTELLEQRLSSVSKILPSLDTHLCSTFMRGGLSAAEFFIKAYPAMESFSAEEAKAWITFNKAAIEAQLNGAPVIVLSTDNATQGIVKIAQSMYGPQSSAFISGLVNLKTANDEDTCTTVKILYAKGNALPEPYRGYMARMLLTGAEGNEKL
ncbi:hypothetical protein [Paraburkholderia fungorum]|uniref:hypothetical protein n=1 Tax=Paraburkholderia fungorum TaxID=134537 RepID=UPI00248DD9AC|nr:hypothetical protein [Paraburkholderia fungorum]